MVATPIGNLRDMSLRAIDILSSIEVIAAEDTRVISRLLNEYGVKTRLISLHEHNEHATSEKILSLLQQNHSVAIVSDAGTPVVSDPGGYAITAAKQAGFSVVPIPGPNAAITALSGAGSHDVPFLFYGFLPPKSKARQEAINQLKSLPYTLIFYEAPHRVIETVQDLALLLEVERNITVARELTKFFETIYTCPLNQVEAWFEADPQRKKGEFVLIVSGSPIASAKVISDQDMKVLPALLAELPLKQAVDLATQITGINRKFLYAQALEWKKNTEEKD